MMRYLAFFFVVIKAAAQTWQRKRNGNVNDAFLFRFFFLTDKRARLECASKISQIVYFNGRGKKTFSFELFTIR